MTKEESITKKELFERVVELADKVGEWKTIDELEEIAHKRAMLFKTELMEEEVKKNGRNRKRKSEVSKL